MLTLFTLVPTQDVQLEDRTVIGPRTPPSWSLRREGDTGWWELLAPGEGLANSRRLMLFDMGVEVGGFRLYQATVLDRQALAFVRPLLAQIPFWGTVGELRDPQGASGRNAQWVTRAEALVAAFPDRRPEGDTSSLIRPSVTLAGVDAVGDAERGRPGDITEDA